MPTPDGALTWEDIPRSGLKGLVLESLLDGGFYRGTIRLTRLTKSGKLTFMLSDPHILVHRGPPKKGAQAESSWEPCAGPTSLTVDTTSVKPERRRTHVFFRLSNINCANILEGGKLLEPEAERETQGSVPLVLVTDLKLKCTYHVPGSHQCGDRANTAVLASETGETYFRCPKHRGRVREGVRGEVLEKVPHPTLST